MKHVCLTNLTSLLEPVLPCLGLRMTFAYNEHNIIGGFFHMLKIVYHRDL